MKEIISYTKDTKVEEGDQKALLQESLQLPEVYGASHDFVIQSPKFMGEVLGVLEEKEKQELTQFVGKSMEEIEELSSSEFAETIIEKVKENEDILAVILKSRKALFIGALAGIIGTAYAFSPEMAEMLKGLESLDIHPLLGVIMLGMVGGVLGREGAVVGGVIGGVVLGGVVLGGVIGGEVGVGVGEAIGGAVGVVLGGAVGVIAAEEFAKNPSLKKAILAGIGVISAGVISAGVIGAVSVALGEYSGLEATGITLLGAGVGAAIAGIGKGIRQKIQNIRKKDVIETSKIVSKELVAPSDNTVSAFFTNNTEELSSYMNESIPKILSEKEGMLKGERQTLELDLQKAQNIYKNLQANEHVFKDNEEFIGRKEEVEQSMKTYNNSLIKVSEREKVFNVQSKDIYKAVSQIEEKIVSVQRDNDKREQLLKEIDHMSEHAGVRSVKSHNVLQTVDENFKEEVIHLEHLLSNVLVNTALQNSNYEALDEINSENTRVF